MDPIFSIEQGGEGVFELLSPTHINLYDDVINYFIIIELAR